MLRLRPVLLGVGVLNSISCVVNPQSLRRHDEYQFRAALKFGVLFHEIVVLRRVLSENTISVWFVFGVFFGIDQIWSQLRRKLVPRRDSGLDQM